MILSVGMILVGILDSAVSLGAPSFAGDSMAMQEVARIPLWGEYCSFDSDYDGKLELYLFDREGAVVAEHAGSFRFDTTRLRFDMHVIAAGDVDQDGLCDVFGLEGSASWPHLYEARDSWSLPDTCVWVLSRQCGDPAYADIDGDSAWELVYGDQSADRRVVAECKGDNVFEDVATLWPSQPSPQGQVFGQMAFCPDLDGDGRPEIVEGGMWWLYFFESPCDDSVECVFDMQLVPRGYYIDAAAWAPDMDRNGKDEVVVFGQDVGGSRLWVIEAVSNDSFEVVWEQGLDDGPGYRTTSAVAVGDVDGDGVHEFAVIAGGMVRIYKAESTATYDMWWWHGAEREALKLVDVNGDGRADLIHTGVWECIVWSYQPLPVEEREQERLEAIVLEPSVVRAGVSVRLVGLPSGARVSVLDVSGRVVRADEGETVSTRGLRPGTYFLRVESGPHSIRRKFLVAG